MTRHRGTPGVVVDPGSVGENASPLGTPGPRTVGGTAA